MVINQIILLTQKMLRKIEDFNVTDFQEITERQFDDAYNNHLPNKWISFAFKYFSKKTENENLIIGKNIQYYLIGLFLFGLISTILKLPHAIIGIFTIGLTISMVGLVLYLLSAVILNRFRITKIRKSLGITKSEYEYLIDKFKK